MAIFCAAVADWRTEDNAQQKMKKDGSGQPPALKLTENPDILKSVGHLKNHRPALVVGFAAETRDLLESARSKLERKGMDMIVANDVSASDAGFAVDTNRVTFLHRSGVMEALPLMDKTEVAAEIIERVVEMLNIDG